MIQVHQTKWTYNGFSSTSLYDEINSILKYGTYEIIAVVPTKYTKHPGNIESELIEALIIYKNK